MRRPPNHRRGLTLFFASLLCGLFSVAPIAAADEATAEQLEFFEKKIRPLLSANCHECHSAATRQRGGLRLDSRDTILKGGDTGPAVIPKQPEKSLLIKAVSYTDSDLRMPPKSKLTDEQIADLKRWVEMGAPWPKTDSVAQKPGTRKFNLQERARHWSFRPVKRPELPEVADKQWPLTPIDHFILAKLEEKGLRPSPPADPRTLLRRVYFDLIGLPPSPEEVEEFVRESDAKPHAALEKVVDRLLNSPHYGERWGRHWLDLVRFAETRGHEFDFEIPEAWRYRDYVIRAFNADVPYDWFIREHLAGDLLPKPRLHPTEKFNESILGTGFWFLEEAKQAPVDVRGDQADRIDNQIDVFGKTFLGLTIACARCHDHMFDPITQRDYYALTGFLQSTRPQMAFFDDAAPLRAKVQELQKLRNEIAKLVNTGVPKIDTLQPNEHQVIFEDFRSPTYRNWFVTGEAFGSGPSRPGDFRIDGDRPALVPVAPYTAHSGLISPKLQGNLRSQTFAISKKKIHFLVQGRGGRINLILDGLHIIRDPIYGKLTFHVNHGDEPRWHTIDVSMWPGHRAYIELLDDGDGYLGVQQIVFADDAPPQWTGIGSRASGIQSANAGRLEEMLQQYRKVEATLPTPRRALAAADGTPIDERLHIRGSHKNLGEVVPRRYLEVFVGNKSDSAARNSSGRLQLAEQLAAPDNPLTARVMVNRLWKHHFGEGIVRSVDNFGVLGEKPSHPELLDWLASEFIRQGWSIKKMHRLMILSRTYQQSSATRAGTVSDRSETIDPDNRLLWRMNVRRLEGEIIRDALLAVSGRLDRTMYGPGVTPYLTEFMIGRGRPGTSGPLDGGGRRSIYINVRRNFLTPMFLVFDYPLPVTTMGRRSVSNVPAQALTMMNNPFILQQTKLWSEKLLAEKGLTPQQRIEKMYVAALGRPPTAEEMRQMLAFLCEQSRLYGREDDPRAWHDLCHVVVNLKEFIFIS